MSRQRRMETPGASFHVSSRGKSGKKMFLDDDDRTRFLVILADVVRQRSWSCYAYCLMSNHYHLLVEIGESDLSRGMQSLNGRYARYFNRRHGAAGHLVESRYFAARKGNHEEFANAFRYIMRNPLESRLVKRPADWPWSSFRATFDLEKPLEFLAVSRLLAHFGGDTQSSLAGVTDLVSQPARKARRGGEPGLRDLFRRIKNKTDRNRAICRAHYEHGYSCSEIGAYLKLHRSTIFRIVHREAPQRQ